MMRVPPHSMRYEAAYLAAVLGSPDAWDMTRGAVNADDFYAEVHRAIYEAAVAVSGPSRTPDTLSVSERLDATGRGDCIEIMLAATNAHPLAEHKALELATDLRKLSRRRKVLQACMALTSQGYDAKVPTDEYLASAEGALFSALQDDHVTSGPQRIDPRAAIKRYEARAAARSDGKTLGLSTTIPLLDEWTVGLGDGHLWFVGGRPGKGKTALAQQIATAACRRGEPGLVFSLEMPLDEVVDRSVSSVSGVSSTVLRSGLLSQWNWTCVAKAAAEMDQWPLYVEDTPGLTLAAISSSAKLASRRWGIRWMIIDYLQLMGAERRKGDNREQEVAAITKGLKSLAKQLGIPIICLSQLNRNLEDRGDQRPKLSDFRESGSIEQDADGAILIWRRKNDTVLCLDKHRHGPTGEVVVEFNGPTTTFVQSDNQDKKEEATGNDRDHD
jgi:replicative DNA helicase